MGRLLFILSVFFGLLAVGIGAFGAHALKDVLTSEMKVVFETGNKYHFYHSLVLLVTSLLITLSKDYSLYFSKKYLTYSGFAFVLGLIIFPFSLYALAITEIKILGAITPIGGMSFLIGWLFLAISARKS